MVASAPALLLISLVTAAAVSGCTGEPPKPDQSARSPTSPSQPVLGTNFTSGPTVNAGIANMTDCAGHRIVVDVPASDYAAHLPPGFKAHQQFPMISSLFLDAWRCRKAALDGTDIGAASFHVTLVVLDPPPGRAPRPAHWYVFVFDAGSPNPAIREFLRPANATISNASISIENEPLGSYFMNSHLQMRQDGAALYDVSFLADTVMESISEKSLGLFDGRASSRVLRIESSGTACGSTYGGTGQWKAGSPIDRIAPGGTVGEIAGCIQSANILLHWE